MFREMQFKQTDLNLHNKDQYESIMRDLKSIAEANADDKAVCKMQRSSGLSSLPQTFDHR
jgi:hypothetical protein